jgi:hypothetical protein
MNEAGRYKQDGREAVCMIKRDPSALHNGCLPASIIKAILLNWSTGFSKHSCIKNWNYVQRSQKETSHLGTWHLIRLWVPRERALFPSGGINTRGDTFT